MADDDGKVNRRAMEKHVKARLKERQGAPKTPFEILAEREGRELIYSDTELDEWKWEYNKNARLLCAVGKRNTGKTVLATNFCYAYRDLYPYGVVFTNTKHNNCKWHAATRQMHPARRSGRP